MSSPETPIPANNPFAGYISQLEAISIDDVVGEVRLGPSQSFGDARAPLESVKGLVRELRILDGTGMPARMLQKSGSAFQEVLSAIQQIRSYNVVNYGGNPNVRGTLVQQLRDGYDNLAESVVPVLLYSQFRMSGLANVQERTQALLAETEKQRSVVGDVVNEAKELLAGQKKFSEEIAIAGYGTLFAKEARDHGQAAVRWLVITGALATLTGIAAVVNYSVSVQLLGQFSKLPGSQVPSVPTSIAVQFAIAKVILFTVGLSAAYWSARVYRSHLHNSIVNKHRANALTSFQEFVVSATDPEVRNAVLLQTTSCIYSPQPTGFSSGSDTDGDSSLKILEIVRNLQR